jgi:acetyl-CoA acetyltransferase
MEPVLIAGVGMTKFGKDPSVSIRSLAEAAVAEAVNDADIPVDEVGITFFSNAAAGLVTGQEMIPGQVALRHTGLLGKPLVNVENACASASSAAYLAWLSVASGHVDVAIAVGAERLSHEDKSRSFAALASAIDLEQVADLEAALYESGDTEGDPSASPIVPSGSLFMDIYASIARNYMARSGATPRNFAEVAVKNHEHGALNPRAQYRNRVSVEEVLESRMIADPLTLLMCSPIGDGAASAVFCSPDRAAGPGERETVRVRAISLMSGVDGGGPGAVEVAAQGAYEQAGVGPQDLDVVELHDAAAPAELSLYEELGLCEPGGGPRLLESGDTRLGGRLPVNLSGGLLSKGHPVGATGCAQLVELTEQLRGHAGERQAEGAEVALAENGGGYLGPDVGAAAVTILSRS